MQNLTNREYAAEKNISLSDISLSAINDYRDFVQKGWANLSEDRLAAIEVALLQTNVEWIWIGSHRGVYHIRTT